MRSKSGLTGRLASTRVASGKPANIPYPQWMKALEEKYQRLHTKIMQSTSVSSVRQFGGPRIRRAEASQSRLSNKTSTFRGSVCQSIVDIGSVDRGTTNKSETVKGVDNNQEVIPEADKIESCDSNKDDGVGTWDRDGTTTPKSPVKRRNSISEELGDVRIKDIFAMEQTISGKDVNKPSLPTPRNLNTSISRTSEKTSKSCPAAIETVSSFPIPPNSRLSLRERPLRPPRRKNLKLFSRMSLEAQHAVNETLIEMGGENSSLRNGDASVIDSVNQDQSVLNRIDSSCASLSPNEVNAGSLSSLDSCASCLSSELFDPRDRRALRGSSCLLPDINRKSNVPKSTTIRTLQPADTLRIPGVGKYNIFTRLHRERTFEITFGDFDIRYRDIISFNRGGSETPPAEIREKAIAKCNEWLTKYTPR